jgi:hypothetical protein
MMNMIELQDKLKNFSQDQLVSMMQQPTGEAPQFMVLSEITRRQKMQKEAESQQAPTQSVAQEAVAAAGVPQGGIADMARSLAPQTNVAQNTGVNPAAPPQGMPMPSAPQGPAPMAAAPQGIARMASGGVIKMAPGGPVDLDRYRELARRLIRDGSFSPEELKELEQIKDTPAWNEALSLEARLANSESLSDINPALPRVESSAPTPVFDATVEVPSLNQAPAADTAIYGGGVADGVTYDSAAPSGLAALSPETMPTVDGPQEKQAQMQDPTMVNQGASPEWAKTAADFLRKQYPARFSTNLGPRAMLDWEEGQAEEAALIDARTNADLGSGRTPRYDTAIGPQPTSEVDSSGMDLVSMLRAQEDARTPRYDTAIGPQPAPPEFIPWDKTGKNKENFGMFGQYEAGMDYLLSKARDTINKGNMLSFDASPTEEGTATLDRITADHLASRREEAAMLGDPNLDPNMRRALENRIFLRKNFANVGADTLDAGLGVAAKYGAAPITDLAAGAVSVFSPTSAANMYNFADRIRSGADQVTENKPTTANSIEEAAITSALDASKVRKSKDTPLEKSVLAAELTDAMKPKPRPEDLFAPTTDNAREGGGSGTGSGTGSGSGGMSDYETELMKIMKSREKAAESDKWLALAQVGMGLMQGGSGSFLGDVGAAGMKGLETLRTSRDQADTDKLSLLKAREDARIDRARIAASAAKGTATDPVDILKGVTEIDNQIANIGRQGLDASTLEMRIAQLQAAKNALMDLYYKSIGSSFRSPVAAGPKDVSNEKGFSAWLPDWVKN